MGKGVGWGLTVGAMVNVVGAGETVGEPVGRWVGNAVGLRVGRKVGENVGNRVGESVGSPVGMGVGTNVGKEVGFAVIGAVVGLLVGLTTGACVVTAGDGGSVSATNGSGEGAGLKFGGRFVVLDALPIPITPGKELRYDEG